MLRTTTVAGLGVPIFRVFTVVVGSADPDEVADCDPGCLQI